jgi:uncharacterized Zn-binding protein involved in type VI secretion
VQLDTPNSQVCKALIDKIRTLLTCNDWTQQEAARFCGQIQPRVSDLLRGNAEFMAKVAARPIKGTYDLATLGAKTKHGGEVATAIMGIEINGHRIACVGDVVRYPDGTESKIVSGAGAALAYKGKPMAIVGSAVANGDTITSSLQSATQIREYADDTGIPGLLQPAYLAPIQGHA